MEFTGQVLSKTPPKLLCFHGGEPFYYVKMMDQIMSAVRSIGATQPFYIQTNGSLITSNAEFVAKWGPQLEVSISYDFVYQELNRTVFDIEAAANVLKSSGVRGAQFQYVIPINDSKSFSFRTIERILNVCRRTGINRVNLIPLRHIRGKTKFEVLVDDVPIAQFLDAFCKFIQTLYIHHIDVIVDGHGMGHDKQYFDDHKMMIVSPDGFLYPEYDFLEYKEVGARIGTWREGHIVRTTDGNERIVPPSCKQCISHDVCGLKYLHGMFNTQPKTKACQEFYQAIDIAIKHAQKLKQKRNLLEWVGI